MELEFGDFLNEYNTFRSNRDVIFTIYGESNHDSQENIIYSEFKNLDVKMRLAFGISEIRLNNEFVDDKQGDLRQCHLLYYKLTDLWFAYETYLKFFKAVVGKGKYKIVWLDNESQDDYSASQIIGNALNTATVAFVEKYTSENKRIELIEYLEYCKHQSSGGQKQRLDSFILKLREGNFDLTHTELLAITYAIRNNFVHNGETTVVPQIFGFENKSILLLILYKYLCVVLITATNITCNRCLNVTV